MTNVTEKDLLIKAKSLIDSPEKWTQKFYARDEKNSSINFDSTSACRFCLLGSLYKSADDLRLTSYSDITINARLHLEAKINLPHFNVVQFNDDPKTTHADVISLLDKTIESLS